MSYTINPNAKNKWARNAENTMDLSLETDASSVYLDNGRTLEQEIGEGSMVSNVATVDSAMSKVIDGTLDGAYESGVMYGRSLVNLSSLKNEIIQTESKGVVRENIYNIKQNTVYTLIVKIKSSNPLTNVSPTSFFRITDIIDNKGTLGTHLTGIVGNVGTDYTTFSTTFTTRSNSQGIQLMTRNAYGDWGMTSNTMYIKEVVIIEGNHTGENTPYFEGLCDVKMPILHNLSSEAFCHDSLEAGTISGSGGVDTTASNARARTKGKKRLNGATSVLFSDNLLGVEKYLFSYDSNGKYLGRTPDNWETGNEIKPVDGAYYYRVVFTKYLEELPHSMYIIPKNHKTNILHTPEIVTLRSLPNGVRDELNLKTGEYIKRIGEIVLDGSEGWGYQPRDNEVNTLMFQCDVHDMKILQPEDNHSDKVLACDKHKVLSSHQLWGTDTQAISKGQSTKQIRIRVLKSNLATLDVAGFKLWLSQNPITVQYELAGPITTTIEPLTIPFAYENGHIVLESGYEGQSLLPTLEYSTVINRTGQIQSIANTVQKQEKQITKLEQMLIQNIVNLDYNNTLLTLKNEMEEML